MRTNYLQNRERSVQNMKTGCFILGAVAGGMAGMTAATLLMPKLNPKCKRVVNRCRRKLMSMMP